MIRRELFNFQDKLYFVERKVKETHVKPEFVNDLKEYWKCDNVVKQIFRQTNDVYYLFLVEIPEAVIVTD